MVILLQENSGPGTGTGPRMGRGLNTDPRPRPETDQDLISNTIPVPTGIFFGEKPFKSGSGNRVSVGLGSNCYPQLQVSQKLQRCKFELSRWSKIEFGDNRRKLTQLKAVIINLQQLPYYDATDTQLRSFKEKFKMVLLREEMYRHQRSRINWLNCGDKNTSFFHATVTPPTLSKHGT